MQRLMILLLSATAPLVTASGCGFMSQMMYWTQGNPVDAKFNGLKGKNVVVVCFDANAVGQAGDADLLAKAVASKLAMNVDKITVVPHPKVLAWIDEQTENVSDYRAVGRGVKADMVVGIDLDSFSIHDGPNLLRGRARVSVKVYDLKKGDDTSLVYQTPPLDLNFPENGPSITDNEGSFRRSFLDTLSKKIAKDFYSYQRLEDFAMDNRYNGD